MNLRLLCPLDNGPNITNQNLMQAIELALDRSGYIQLRELDIRVDGDHVYMHGRLPSYYLKQLAGHIISRVPGIYTVVDQVDVTS